MAVSISGTSTSKTELIDNLATSTFYSMRNEIIDQAFKITPFFDRLWEKGKIKERIPDGTHFEVPVRYGDQSQNRKWFGRGDKFGTSEKEYLTRMLFYVRNLGVSLVRTWEDDQKNRGKAKLFDYVVDLIETAKLTMTDALEDDLLAQNVDPLSITALATLISTTPTTGTVGTKSRSTDTYLQNQIKDFSGLSTANNLLDEMTRMYNLCSQWKANKQRTPDIIITERRVYQDYERICRALQQISTNKTERASLGFGDLMFKNVEMFWAPQCPSGNMYMLNSETLELDYDPSNWMEMTEWKTEPNSLDRYCQIVSRCQFICTSPQRNGVIFSITPTTA